LKLILSEPNTPCAVFPSLQLISQPKDKIALAKLKAKPPSKVV
jgi:hypothetical protein